MPKDTATPYFPQDKVRSAALHSSPSARTAELDDVAGQCQVGLGDGHRAEPIAFSAASA
jgi:hypothetical protein